MDQEVVDEYLSQDYFKRDPPKTTGRELFGDAEAAALIEKCLARGNSQFDVIATLTRITAQSIVNDYKKYSPYPIDELYLCGGGVFNPNITNYIKQSFPETSLILLDITGIKGNAKEAITFAFQGLEAILGRPLNVPDRVETKTPVVVGKITPGLNYRELQTTLVNFVDGYNCKGYLPSVRKLVIDDPV